MGIYSTSKSLVSQWAEGTKRKLQARGRPNTKVDSGGTQSNYTFDGQEISRSELRDVKEMRESGGVVSHLVHAKAMMQFGPGATFQAEEDDASEWLEEQFNDLDNLLIDLGEDATWFPYALAEIVETQGGDFSHVELVEPWTTLPVENEVGEVIAWEQEIKGDFQSTTETFEPDEIASFVLNKSSGRDKTGVSEVLRAEDEITNFKENQKVMGDALEYLVPHHHWIIGQEGQSVIDDNELRRFRNRIDSMKGDTQIISGPGVKHEQIDLPKFDIKEITNNDLRQLCVALGVPIELASVISEGLGSGEQSSARQVFFELEKDAKQRALGGQFVEQIARILLRDYSPYDEGQTLDLVFNDARTQEERKTTVDAIGDDLTVNERRELFDYAELDDEAEGESFDSPGEETSQDDPFGGMFSEGEEGNLSLGDGTSLEEFEAWMDTIHNDMVCGDKTGKALTTFTESQIPQMVKNRLRDAILGEAVFSQFDTLPSSDIMQLRNYMIEELDQDGWSLDGLANRIQDLDTDMTFDEAQTIARTETQSAVNHAAESAYESMEEERGAEFRYKWVGSTDSRTTDACLWLLGGDDLANNISKSFNGTNPNHGGTPLPMSELKQKIQEAAEADPEINTSARTFTPHINCRKRYVRVVD